MPLNKNKFIDIVISDTTALIVFAKTDTLFLLSNLFNKVYIPKAVNNEIHSKNDIISYQIKNSNFIEVRSIENLHILERITKFKLDLGETEAITLALELNLKLIIDERKGRKIATNQGISIVGILGILRENYIQKFITIKDLHYYFNLFKNNQLRISKELEIVFFDSLI